MKTRLNRLLVVIPFLLSLTGCSVMKAVFTEFPEQGVVVVNTMPATQINVVVQAVYGRQTFGKGLLAGQQCFVPAALFPQSQTFVVTVHVYDMSANYVGSRSRQFSFYNSGGSHCRNQQWDVMKRDLARN